MTVFCCYHRILQHDGRSNFQLKRSKQVSCFKLLNHQKPNFLQKEDYIAKIDLARSYYYILIKEKRRRFLSKVYTNKVYHMTCLPFGLSSALLAFARISNWIANQLRNKKIRVDVYLDHFLIAGHNPESLRCYLLETVKLLENLGSIVNKKNSTFLLCSKIEYLGIEFNTKDNQMSLPAKKRVLINKEVVSNCRKNLQQNSLLFTRRQ